KFTQALRAAPKDLQEQVFHGGFFALVKRGNQYRIYNLGALGTPIEQVKNNLLSVEAAAQKQAIYDERKSAKRRNRKVDEAQVAERVFKEFEQGELYEILYELKDFPNPPDDLGYFVYSAPSSPKSES